jgi:hypothetical protein
MGLKSYEWKESLRIVWKLVDIPVLFIRKLFIKGKSFFIKTSINEVSFEKNKDTKSLEPKIDFNSIKNEPVSNYGNDKEEQTIINQQDEIIFEGNLYKAPDINFLSKPELSKGNVVNQVELDSNAEKLKNVLTDFKIEG